ncbi:MAG: haloalkane dehalogenase [Bacteroidota bacterium]
MKRRNKHNKKSTQYLKVNNAYIHFIEQGTGEPILFLHGNPTSSYIWRHIIPCLNEEARCIAPDLIGMGKSDKPNIEYNFMDHYVFIRDFIKNMELTNVTLVLHDWGSALGFYYAMNHPDNIKAIAFMESIIKPWKWKNLKWNYRLAFRFLRTPGIGEAMIYGRNAFLNDVLPNLIQRKLKKNELRIYKAPFKKSSHRKPMLKWPREIPINGRPKHTYQIVSGYSNFLKYSVHPKLLLYAQTGAMIRKKEVKWAQSQFRNLTCQYVGPGLHFLQEDQPEEIGLKLKEWWLRIK